MTGEEDPTRVWNAPGWPDDVHVYLPDTNFIDTQAYVLEFGLTKEATEDLRKALNRYHDTGQSTDKKPQPSPQEAAEAHLTGWNLRCNVCGLYGATWVPKMRPGWGALALCEPHAQQLRNLQRRHKDELDELTTVKYEQDRQTP